MFTTATWIPFGSPPTHRQIREIWMTGSKNWKHNELPTQAGRVGNNILLLIARYYQKMLSCTTYPGILFIRTIVLIIRAAMFLHFGSTCLARNFQSAKDMKREKQHHSLCLIIRRFPPIYPSSCKSRWNEKAACSPETNQTGKMSTAIWKRVVCVPHWIEGTIACIMDTAIRNLKQQYNDSLSWN